MIIFFTTKRHQYTVNGFIRSRFRKVKAKVRSYDWLFRQSSVRAAACVFTDFDRLRHFELVMAGKAYRQLQSAGISVLNDPARCCQRKELLFRLHRAGLNKFRAYPAALDPYPSRFPVFLKCESDHRQAFRELIGSQSALERRLEEIRASGFPLHYMLVIEFANRQHRDGVYRRHTIYRIGERMVAANPVTEADPFVKYGVRGLASDADLAASTAEIMKNPHAEYMRKVFEIAEIEYGRADFGFDGETPAVFEINTNPNIGLRVRGAVGAYADAVQHSMHMIADAVNALDGEDRRARLTYPKAPLSRRTGRRISRAIRLSELLDLIRRPN